MGEHPYQICTRCIMDTSNPNILFDDDGRCDYCVNFDTVLKPKWDADTADRSRLMAMADEIKAQGRATSTAVIGLSGGLDSSFAAHIARM